MSRVLRGLTENHASTDPTATDRRLRGRTYAIPFEAVWSAALRIAPELRGWTVVRADDESGEIVAESATLVWRFVDDVRIRVTLDENAQTRVDMESSSRKGKGDLGRNARTIAGFFRRLDRELSVQPSQILDPTRRPAWHDVG